MSRAAFTDAQARALTLGARLLRADAARTRQVADRLVAAAQPLKPLGHPGVSATVLAALRELAELEEESAADLEQLAAGGAAAKVSGGRG